MRFWQSKRRLATCVVVLLALLFLVRPGANRLRTRIVSSISLALGRPVEVGFVRFRLLPRPGFDLENFVVHDDPAFGAEPMLRAQEVTASLRLRSLLRGHLEISRLDFSEPSLTLVRSQGQWNLANLVERSEKIAVAPTAKVNNDKRPGFPYIEGSQARINFKIGQEKKPYALTDADFSLWQETDNEWGIRLKARPVSSDFNLTDTGVLQVRGSWQRAPSLRESPLQFGFGLEGAQLGQLSKLAYGNDAGWRGAVKLSVSLTGTVQNLAISAQASADDFRRFDIISTEHLPLQTRCSAHYTSATHSLSEIACHVPMGSGEANLTGEIDNAFATPAYNLEVFARSVPVQSLLVFARHAYAGISDDAITAGELDGELHGKLVAGANHASWEGVGQTSEVQLKSLHSDTAVALGAIPLAISAQQARLGSRPSSQSSSSPKEQLQIGPVRVAFGKATPLTVEGRLSREGYAFEFSGEGQLKPLLETARLVGIHVPQLNAEGSARLDLQLSGQWSGTESHRVVGKAQLHSVRAQVSGFNAPLQISSANLVLTPDQVAVEKLVASAAGASWRGSLMITRPCATSAACAVQFNLHADEIAIDRVNQLLNPRAKEEPWYRALSPASGTPYLMKVNASGKLAAERFKISKLEAKDVIANVELKSGKLVASNLKADVLGGQHIGEWKADFTVRPPQYTGTGTFDRIALAQVAQVMNHDWITGTATATYQASTAGLTSAELFSAAVANLQLDSSSGTLSHLVLASAAAPLQMRHLAAHLLLHDGQLDIRAGQLQTASDVFHLSGTASLTQALNLKLIRDDSSGFNITGTLTEPHVSEVSAAETRAALKQ